MNFPRSLKLIMKVSPHDHFSRESAGSAPVPSKGNVDKETHIPTSSFYYLMHFPFAHFMMLFTVSLLTSGLVGRMVCRAEGKGINPRGVNYVLELLQ